MGNNTPVYYNRSRALEFVRAYDERAPLTAAERDALPTGVKSALTRALNKLSPAERASVTNLQRAVNGSAPGRTTPETGNQAMPANISCPPPVRQVAPLAAISLDDAFPDEQAPPRDARSALRGVASRNRDPLDSPIQIILEALLETGIVSKKWVESAVGNGASNFFQLMRALGPGALPIWANALDAEGYRDRSGFIRALEKWPLSTKDAIAIHRWAQSLDDNLLGQQIQMGIAYNENLPDTARRALMTDLLVQSAGTAALTDKRLSARTPSPAELLRRGTEHPDWRIRRMTSGLLQAGQLGFDTVSLQERTESVDTLLSDTDWRVRRSALPLFWKSSDTSPEAQSRQLEFFSNDDLADMVDGHLNANHRVFFPMLDNVKQPEGFHENMHAFLALTAGVLLLEAPEGGDISRLVEAAASHGKLLHHPKAAHDAVLAAFRSSLPLEDKLKVAQRLSWTEWDGPSLEAISAYLLTTPGAVDAMPRSLRYRVVRAATFHAGGTRQEQEARMAALRDAVSNAPEGALTKELSDRSVRRAALDLLSLKETSSKEIFREIDLSKTEHKRYARRALKRLTTPQWERLGSEDTDTSGSYAPSSAQMATALDLEPSRFVDALVEHADAALSPKIVGKVLTGIEILCGHPRVSRRQLKRLLKAAMHILGSPNARYARGSEDRGRWSPSGPKVETFLSRESRRGLFMRFMDSRLQEGDTGILLRALADGAHEEGDMHRIILQLEEMGLRTDVSRALARRSETAVISPSAFKPWMLDRKSLSKQFEKLSPLAYLREQIGKQDRDRGSLEEAAREIFGRALERPDSELRSIKKAEEYLEEAPQGVVPERDAFLFAISAGLKNIGPRRMKKALKGLDARHIPNRLKHPIRFAADVNRGMNFDALCDAYEDLLPLDWEGAKAVRPKGESRSLHHLFEHALNQTTGEHRWWCLPLIARCGHLERNVREGWIASHIRVNGGLKDHLGDPTGLAMAALVEWRGRDLSFAAPALLQRAQLHGSRTHYEADKEEHILFERLLGDRRFSVEAAVDICLTLVMNRSESRWQHRPSTRRPEHRPELAEVVHVLLKTLQRKDLTAEQRLLIEGAGHLYLERIERLEESRLRPTNQ